MSEFKLADSNIFKMKGSDVFYHVATIHNGLREYICMIEALTQQCYIEEITGGHLSFIEDDNLALALAQFCEEKGVKDMGRFLHFIQRSHGP
jgi:hypothetical protein